MLHSSCEICSVSLRRWGDGISLAGQNVFADLVWDGNSAPFTPIFCILSQDSTNAFLLSFSIFSVLISCLWCVCQTAQWNSWVRLLARNFDWLQRKRGKECRELAENAVTLLQRKREAQSTAAGLIYRKAKKHEEVLLEYWGLGRLEERVSEVVKTEFWQCLIWLSDNAVCKEATQKKLRWVSSTWRLALPSSFFWKKKKKSYSDSQKRHSSATVHVYTTQVEKSPVSPLLLRASCQGPSLNRLLMKTLQSISCLGGEKMLERKGANYVE